MRRSTAAPKKIHTPNVCLFDGFDRRANKYNEENKMSAVTRYSPQSALSPSLSLTHSRAHSCQLYYYFEYERNLEVSSTLVCTLLCIVLYCSEHTTHSHLVEWILKCSAHMCLDTWAYVACVCVLRFVCERCFTDGIINHDEYIAYSVSLNIVALRAFSLSVSTWLCGRICIYSNVGAAIASGSLSLFLARLDLGWIDVE